MSLIRLEGPDPHDNSIEGQSSPETIKIITCTHGSKMVKWPELSAEFGKLQPSQYTGVTTNR